MIDYLLIFFGAGLGGLLRHWVANSTHLLLGRDFPYGTLAVNISGCFLMGLIFTLLIDRFDEAGLQLRSFLLIGLLGGYTTFSAFSIETLHLIRNGAVYSALLNIIISVTLCMTAVWLGVIAATDRVPSIG